MPNFSSAYSMNIDRDDTGLAVGEKLRAYVNVSTTYSKSSKYQEVGVIRNEQTFNRNIESLEYKDGSNDWLFVPRTETVEMEFAFMQHDPKLWAIAMGLSGVNSTGSTKYDDIISDGNLAAAPKYPWKFVTERVGGKDIEIEFVAGQVVSESLSAEFGGSDATQMPITVRAMIKDASTIGFKKYRVRFAK
jgi:hypothetical protein